MNKIGPKKSSEKYICVGCDYFDFGLNLCWTNCEHPDFYI